MIQIESVSYAHRDGEKLIHALQNINLTVKQGEWISVTGANGSGKSTLSRMLNGLLVPTKGTVQVAGLDLADSKNRELVKQKVQLVFQNPDAQMVGSTPIEDVAFGLENRGYSSEDMRSRIEEVLRKVGLQHKFHADVSSLSGGQRQRLAIASCLALEPDCLIFDEATSMLDPVGRQEIYGIARSLWRKGMTVVWITQRLEELPGEGRIAVFEKGTIVYEGDARTLFYHSELPARLRWELPPVVQIGHLLKHQGTPVDQLPLCEEDLEDLVCE
ncbi:ATP-binding cassette domain-containing protein [Paenibacillus filicis]|uniref:ATP-binding cassette domain-containing protein n=1 Tax=Paenibacillus filicis TaxID=669464 RepID=A0ABU9DD03_9BACL